MTKEYLSARGAFSMITLIITANSIILGLTNNIGTETWLAILLMAVFSLPLMLLFARLIRLMPGMNIFEMARQLFGAVGEKIFAVLYAVYFLLLTAIIRAYYAEFVHITSLVQTPFIVILLVFFVVCTYLAKSGFSTMSRWYPSILFFVCAVMLAITLFSIPRMTLDNMLPLVEGDTGRVVRAAISGINLPIGEMVIVMSFAGNLERTVNPYKLFLGSLAVSTLFLLLVFSQNMSVLGEHVVSAVYYPTYTAASVIDVGSAGIRVESLIILAFLLAGISKTAACLAASGQSLSSLFNISNPGLIIVPVGFFTVALSAIAFKSNVELREHIKAEPYFAAIFQILLPTILWAAAEIQRKRGKLTVGRPQSGPDEDKAIENAADGSAGGAS